MDIIINEINTDSISIDDINFRPITNRLPPVPQVFQAQPVVIDIGVPIINIPGCVEAHEQNKKDNFAINVEDPKGVKVFCDAGTPSFNPMDYNKKDLTFSSEAPIPAYKGEETKQSPDAGAKDTPAPKTSAATVDIQCPTQKQLDEEPVGFLFDSGRKEVLGYKLVGDQCIREIGDVPIVTQVLNGLPPTGVVITTGGIAVVATTSALLAKPFADILLKVIKPTVKKVLKKVAAIRGKKLKVVSLSERRMEQRDRNSAIMALRKTLKPK